MGENKRKVIACFCKARQRQIRQERRECKRKRPGFVFNLEEELWHEPYMQCLRKEFSEVSLPCDSKIELPWKDIALPAVGMKIRQDVNSNVEVDEETIINDETGATDELEKKESSGTMTLPWNQLIVTDIVQSSGDPSQCDSSLEIPWADLTLERPVVIQEMPVEETCDESEVEVPWGDILVPPNIVIAPRKVKRHPSSKHSPRKSTCGKNCPPCCIRGKCYKQ